MNLGRPTAFVLVMAALFVAPFDRTQATELHVPRIYLVAPAADAPVTSSTHVALRFEAPSGSDIDVGSFQVLYQFGFFKKDITKQILQFATLTPAGVTGSTPPELPPGVHTLLIRIRDTQHRSGELMLSLRIGR